MNKKSTCESAIFIYQDLFVYKKKIYIYKLKIKMEKKWCIFMNDVYSHILRTESFVLVFDATKWCIFMNEGQKYEILNSLTSKQFNT